VDEFVIQRRVESVECRFEDCHIVLLAFFVLVVDDVEVVDREEVARIAAECNLLLRRLVEGKVEQIRLRNSDKAGVEVGPRVLREHDIIALAGNADGSRAVVVLLCADFVEPRLRIRVVF